MLVIRNFLMFTDESELESERHCQEMVSVIYHTYNVTDVSKKKIRK